MKDGRVKGRIGSGRKRKLLIRKGIKKRENEIKDIMKEIK